MKKILLVMTAFTIAATGVVADIKQPVKKSGLALDVNIN
jgi:hypothetical protein